MTITACKMPDGRSNKYKVKIEAVESGGATFYVKREIKDIQIQVRGAEYHEHANLMTRKRWG